MTTPADAIRPAIPAADAARPAIPAADAIRPAIPAADAIRPVVLDFDASVPFLGPEEIRLPLADWQEDIRFGCPLERYAALESHLDGLMPDTHGPVFTGSGDYHHLTLYLLKRLMRRGVAAALDIVVCDNHPDNMRYPFGLHCGSWVSHAAALPGVRRIHVAGITSADIGWRHAWENRLAPFVRKKLFYWSLGRGAAWLKLIGRGDHNRSFDAPDDLVKALALELRHSPALYLSMDKDVLSPAFARTNWDQGRFAPEHLGDVIGACAGRLLGADVTGDASTYSYAGRFKRILSRLDGQPEPDEAALSAWRGNHAAINRRLLEWIAAAAPAGRE